MGNDAVVEKALQPEDLAKFFVLRANAGDVEGLVALYESNAVLACAHGKVATGTEAIRAFYTALLGTHPHFAPGLPSPTLRNENIALTSSRLGSGDVTVEIARRQPDGSWLWMVDQPAIGKWF